MTIAETSTDFVAFERSTLQTAIDVFTVLRRTGVLSATGTIQINERVPGEEKIVGIEYPSPWKSRNPQAKSAVFGFGGTSYSGDPRSARGARRFAAIFERHTDVTTVVHIHSPYLGAWAQAHLALPVHDRLLACSMPVGELPVYKDRRQAEVDFILEQLARDPRIPAIVEANGGATVWGRDGLGETARFIVALEQSAKSQALACSIDAGTAA